MLFRFPRRVSSSAKLPPRRRALRGESLEPRHLLAADPLVFDSDDTAWQSLWNATSDQWSESFQELRSDYLPVDIEITEVSGQARIGGSWIENTDGRRWAQLRNLSSESFSTRWNEYREQGYRLVDQESYVLGGQRYYAGIWVENTERYDWLSYRNLTADRLQELFDTYEDDYLPVDLDAYEVNGSLRYAAAFVESPGNLAWQARYGLTSDEFGDLFDSLRGSYRVTDIESYQLNGQQRYAVVWVENENGRSWASRRNLSETGFWNEFNSYRDRGYRLVDYERYQSGSQWRYAAVWRQNGDRLNWDLRSDVDALATDHLNDFNVPGIGVAVVQDGEFLYRRGFGYQDVKAGLQYSSRTVNRLASVSKAVAGVLALDLVEKGLLDINRRTASYTGTVYGESIPSHHTHTLLQLLSNRGGIGHYDELGDVNGVFATALEASAEFWDEPLTVSPAGSGYHYSTHGYTLLGAAIEGALGQPIQQIVQQRLTDAFDLNTLRVEDRGVANRYRSAVYRTGTTAVTADNTSWKILGGGLESSVYDLARFGAKLLSGQILSERSRATLWTPPPPDDEDYGLGWDLGTRRGLQWVGKSGGQLGANTYLLMYPSQDLVIAVLTNRQGGGHSAGRLAREIADLILDDEPATPSQNIRIRQDVNDDGQVSLADVLACVQTLRSATSNTAPTDPQSTSLYLDVNGDRQVSIADLLEIVVELRRALTAEGEATDLSPEGEATAAPPMLVITPVVVSKADSSERFSPQESEAEALPLQDLSRTPESTPPATSDSTTPTSASNVQLSKDDRDDEGSTALEAMIQDIAQHLGARPTASS